MNDYRTVQIEVDNTDLLTYVTNFVENRNGEYFCEDQRAENPVVLKMPIHFKVEHTYDIFKVLGGYWGFWNDCPSAETMWEKSREWYLKYEAELMELSHDTLKFQCGRELNKTEAQALMEDILEFAPDSPGIVRERIDIYERLLQQGYFILWWD